MKVYTVIAKYMGYDEFPDNYIGTFDSLETIIENEGTEMDFINEKWGDLDSYIEWVKSDTQRCFQTDRGLCYMISGRNLEWGYFLYIYETDLITKHIDFKFV